MRTTIARLRADGAIWPGLFVLAAWSYWALFSLVTPVTVWDAHTYNLARLELARMGGLFGNPYWNSGRQVFLPWTFDSVHFPFLLIGFGTSLPSFACLTGLLLIVFRMVAARFSRRAAWWCCAALLALPTLVYQASSTKNDLAVVFALGCWAYAGSLYRTAPRRRYVALMALSLAFAAGSKTSGVVFALLLLPWTLWTLRGAASECAAFVGILVVCLVLWGSLETYANTLRIYGHALGPRQFVEDLRNRDGAAGAAANFLRYAIGNTNVGLDSVHPSPALIAAWDRAARSLLGKVGLGNMGYAAGYGDASLHFWKDGWEASSDFGLLGGIALWFSLIALAIRPRSDPLWALSALAIGSLLVICATIGWMPWNGRFLMVSFVLSAVVLALAAERSSRPVRALFGAAVIISGVVAPSFSFNKGPTALFAALLDRKAFETRENPGMFEVIRDLETRAGSGSVTEITVCAGADSWILPLFSIPGLSVHPEADRGKVSRPERGQGARFVLLLNTVGDGPPLEGWVEIRGYAEADSGLYRLDAAR